MANVRFTFLSGDCNWLDFGGKWISQKFNNGDFDYWLVKELIPMGEHVDDYPTKYHCNLCVVAPSEIPSKEWSSVLQTCGWDKEGEYTDLDRVEMAHSYGNSNQVWNNDGNNFKELFKECSKESNILTSLTFGFAMDKQANAIGATGWDMLKGNVWGDRQS